jgi:succinoglycan biosynthesis protein ExoO
MDHRFRELAKVSVIMAAHNSARTIDRAIDSVLSQTYGRWQLIIVDDASTDATLQRVEVRREGRENKVVVVHCQENGGPAKARNTGLEICDGEWVAVLDADDAWHENRLEVLLRKATESSADAVCDNLLGFDDHIGETEPLYAALPAVLDLVTAVAPTYSGNYNLGYLKPIVRRSFVEDHQIRYDESLRTGEDLLYLISLLVHGGRITCIDLPSYIYTIPVGSGNRRLSQSTKTLPRDSDIARSLARVIHRCDADLTNEERQAITERILYLESVAPWSEFRYAWIQKKWFLLLKLFLTHSKIRTRIRRSLKLRG